MVLPIKVDGQLANKRKKSNERREHGEEAGPQIDQGE